MTGLAQRVGTALVFGAVMLGGLFGGPYTFVLLFLVVTAACLWEFLSLCLPSSEDDTNSFRQLLGTTLGLIPIILVSVHQLEWVAEPGVFLHKGLILLIPLTFLLFIFELFHQAKLPYQNLAYQVLGLVYIGLPFALLVMMATPNGQYSPNLVLGMLLLTWANDTGAYFVGSKLGKTPLFPRISPKKTWEGSLGGVILGILLGGVLSLFFTEFSMTEWLIIAVIVVISGALGDLVESMLKRSLNIKDSGNILPGHGGFLDRFDAFIFVIPFVMAFLQFIR